MEIWKNIKDCDYYQVSNFGGFKRLARLGASKRSSKSHTKVMPEKARKYITVDLNIENKCRSVNLHRLVAIAFVPNPDNKPQVNHINSIKTDNNASNLEWVTARENSSHSALSKKHIKYVGIYLRKNKYVSSINFKGNTENIGVYNCETKAFIERLIFMKKNNLVTKNQMYLSK
jgi:hypothetical protein